MSEPSLVEPPVPIIKPTNRKNSMKIFANPISSAGLRHLLAISCFSLSLIGTSPSVVAAAPAAKQKATVVLVHGAMADSSSWSAVIPKLVAQGFSVIAAPNPLRDLKTDSQQVSSLLKSIDGPVVLVGHSYGGSVISNAAVGSDNVKALVFVAAFAPEKGETAFDLVGKFPGSILGDALSPPVSLQDGGKDLYIDQKKFRAAFAADIPSAKAQLMAATLRPVTQAALTTPSDTPAWKTIPSWFVFGSADKSIPPASLAFMAARAQAKKVVVVPGASHVVMLSKPDEVTKVIVEAANAQSK